MNAKQFVEWFNGLMTQIDADAVDSDTNCPSQFSPTEAQWTEIRSKVAELEAALKPISAAGLAFTEQVCNRTMDGETFEAFGKRAESLIRSDYAKPTLEDKLEFLSLWEEKKRRTAENISYGAVTVDYAGPAPVWVDIQR